MGLNTTYIPVILTTITWFPNRLVCNLSKLWLVSLKHQYKKDWQKSIEILDNKLKVLYLKGTLTEFFLCLFRYYGQKMLSAQKKILLIK